MRNCSTQSNAAFGSSRYEGRHLLITVCNRSTTAAPVLLEMVQHTVGYRKMIAREAAQSHKRNHGLF